MSRYCQNHKLAKLIMALIVCGLLAFDGSLSLLQWMAVLVWVFGVNPIGYFIETLRKHPHEHDKI